MTAGKYTPMMEQFLQIKKDYNDTILMYRLGDFYEMFFEDAEIASKELDLTLTGRDCGKEERAPMCGVPYHSAEGYIAKLINRGYKIAICEQTENPAEAKGLVKREVVRVITPGTVMEPSILRENENNFIGGIYMQSDMCGVCFCDVSTGKVFATQFLETGFEDALLEELARFSPREMVLSDGANTCGAVTGFLRDKLSCHMEHSGEWRFAAEEAERLAGRFSVESQALTEPLCRCISGLLSYLQETQKNNLSHISQLELYSSVQYMGLDYTARKNLEITSSLQTGDKKGSLLWVLDNTKTSMGARLLRQWLEKPLMSVTAIGLRQNAVAALHKNLPRSEALQEILSVISDIERICGRITFGSANCRDLRSLYGVCTLLPSIQAELTGQEGRFLSRVSQSLDGLEDIATLIDKAITDGDIPFSIREGGIIRDGYDAEVDRLRTLVGGGMSNVLEIEARERERTGIPKLKIGYNRVFGYYIEVGRAHSDKVPDDYIRKQTLANCERYITEELKNLEGELLSANDKLKALEYEIFCGVRSEIAAKAPRILRTAAAIAALDAVNSFAVVARKYNYTMPQVDDSGRIEITDGRHPVVERALSDAVFVPNDTRMDNDENRVYIITGPNMAGKSTFMRQVALITLMAQCGSFVPAESAHIGVCDRIFTRIGASDDMFGGKSTFMVEMTEVADILKHATKDSLLILDEIGRGTSTFDGMSIARAVLEHVADKKHVGAKTLFATHYHELCELEGINPGVKNYNVLVKKRDGDIIFLKKIARGGAGDSYGIDVAKLAGVPESVIRRARAVLRDIESRSPEAVKQVVQSAEEQAQPQLTMSSYAGQEVLERLSLIEPDTCTPMEALSLVYELCKMAKEV